MAAVEASFRKKTGVSTREFRGGRRDTAERDASGPPKAGTLNAITAASGDSCTCALSVYSGYRWMNRYWGLECNNHASHGVCSNNVDSAHTAGTGAMTGDINLYFGSYHQYKECPDDHTTCFHGPSTVTPGSGATSAVATPGTRSTPTLTGLVRRGPLGQPWVHQVSTPYFTVAGSCDGATSP